MIGEQVLVAGTKIRYKMYVWPFEFRTGVIVSSTPDRDKKKLAKYLIELDNPEEHAGEVFRYHPRLDISGKPNRFEDSIEEIFDIE